MGGPQPHGAGLPKGDRLAIGDRTCSDNGRYGRRPWLQRWANSRLSRCKINSWSVPAIGSENLALAIGILLALSAMK
jgi:hypothetical protein